MGKSSSDGSSQNANDVPSGSSASAPQQSIVPTGNPLLDEMKKKRMKM